MASSPGPLDEGHNRKDEGNAQQPSPETNQLGNDTPTPPSLPPKDTVDAGGCKPLDPKNLYDIYRDYIKHEDDLINHRATWHGAWQGLLFTAFGIALNWKPEDPRLYAAVDTMRFIIPILGSFIAFIAAVSLFAAWTAIRKLRRRWEDEVVPKIKGQFSDLLPKLTGGGQRGAEFAGKTTSFIPAVAWIMWLVIFVNLPSHKHDKRDDPGTKKSDPCTICIQSGNPQVHDGDSDKRIEAIEKQLNQMHGDLQKLLPKKPGTKGGKKKQIPLPLCPCQCACVPTTPAPKTP